MAEYTPFKLSRQLTRGKYLKVDETIKGLQNPYPEFELLDGSTFTQFEKSLHQQCLEDHGKFNNWPRSLMEKINQFVQASWMLRSPKLSPKIKKKYQQQKKDFLDEVTQFNKDKAAREVEELGSLFDELSVEVKRLQL